jgi:alpha/beta superfamily hydrolase
MPLTTEVPTFFGPEESPLFGVVHLPIDREIRGGVLICGSLGKEGMDSMRLHRILAEGLARRGFAVLHFDYLGLGDSAYVQGRHDAVANWIASVGHALDYLTLIGAESVTAIGIRAGCLILDGYLAQPHANSRAVNRAVYLDPSGTGRRYLREHTALFRFSAGEDADTPGEVSILGGRLSSRAAAEFGALRMGADPVRARGVEQVLLVTRPAETDKQLTALGSAAGVDSIVTGGLPECAHPLPIPLPIPVTAVDSITEWIDHNVETRTSRAAPRYLTTVTMPAQGPDGTDVVESIERVEPDGLFVIRTQPRRSGPAPTKTVLFFVAGYELHVGPTREWVESSRRIAGAGAQALRWDPARQGLSGEIRRDPWRRVYTNADTSNAVAMARHACHDAGELELVGMCSGAWYAAQVARQIGARSATLANLVVWNWRVLPTLLEQGYFHRQTLTANAPGGDVGGPSESRSAARAKALVRSAQQRTKSLIHKYLPRSVLRILSWVGLAFLPESVLATLARRGTGVTLIVASEDAARFNARGGRAAVDQLQGASQPPRLIDVPAGDHAANHPAMLAAIRSAALPPAAIAHSETSTRRASVTPELLSVRD